MDWTGDVAAGDWLKPLIDDPWRGTMHDAVPRGFESYARVFHPALIDDAPATWAEVARVMATTMHPLAQWNSLVRVPSDAGAQQVTTGSGREIDAPQEGQLDAGILTLLARVLAEHTAAPDAGRVGLWEGWGGLLGGYGTSGRAFFTVGGDAASRTAEIISRSTRDVLNNVFRQPKWEDGILPRDVSEGARLELPGRGYVLFGGGISEFAEPDWELRMPWRDVAAEQHGFEPSSYSPSLIWPDDHAWVLVSEVDWDSTIIAGSRSLVDAICAAPGIEALEIPADASLQYDSDEVNR